jgi:hypothetical protein
MPVRRRLAFLALTFALAVAPIGATVPRAHAARPMITDDARVVDEKACQLESWVRRNRDTTEYWALPACNFGFDTEITLGGARTSDAEGTHASDLLAQAKRVWRSLERTGWGSGIAVGYVSKPALPQVRDLLGDAYAYLVNSFSFVDGRALLHTNVGGAHVREQHANRLIWGVGGELQLSQHVWLIGETFGQSANKPLWQAGARVWLVPDRVQVDATVGNRWISGDERWMSIGLRLLSPPFLP